MAKRSRTAAERAEQMSRLRARPARAQMLVAARELATARGYESIKAGDIATAAGFSRETFYTHFADKRSCLAEATDPRMGEIESELRIAGEEGESWAAPLIASLEATLIEQYGSKTSPRGRIIEAMLALVAEHGYASVRLADVIKEAKVSYPSFYRHFASKDECFAVAFEYVIGRLSTELELRLGAEATQSARLRALAELLAADPDTARLLVLEADGHRQEDLAGCVSSPIPRLIAGGEAENTSTLLCGAVAELLRDAVLTERLETLAGSIDDLVSLLDSPLAEGPSPSRSRRRDWPRRRGSTATKQRAPALAGARGTAP